MPTQKQFLDSMDLGMMGFRSTDPDDGYNVRGSHMAGTGLQPPTQFSGPVIGVLTYDPVEEDFKIEPLPPETKTPQ